MTYNKRNSRVNYCDNINYIIFYKEFEINNFLLCIHYALHDCKILVDFIIINFYFQLCD